MKIALTLDGGLRMDAENTADWLMLHRIVDDTLACTTPLADRLGSLVSDPDVSEDWREFVIPDLRDAFHADVTRIAHIVTSARIAADHGPGSIHITRDDGPLWYGVLNQARLAIEARHRFDSGESTDPSTLPSHDREVLLRSRLYHRIQSILLDHLM